MALSVANARLMVRDFARNAGDSSMYTDTQIDRSIQIIGNRFVRKTSCTVKKSTLAITLGSNALPSFPTNFRPAYIRRARISITGSNKRVDIIGYDDLLNKRDSNDRDGLAEFVAFDSWTSGEVYPEPDAAATLTIWWRDVFTAWTAGGTPSPDSFNIPDELFMEVLATGVVAMLQGHEPENRAIYANKWAEYLELERDSSGAEGLGAQSYEAVADPDGAIAAAGDDDSFIDPVTGI